MVVKTEPVCRLCFQPLIYVLVNKYHRLVCDNTSCVLFREGQGNILRDDNGIQEALKGLSSAWVAV